MSPSESLSLIGGLLAAGVPVGDASQEQSDQAVQPPGFTAVLSALQSLRALKEDDSYVTAIELLADAARDERWRTVYHAHGILQDVVESWAVTDSPALSRQVLRLWGNSCIDDDDNRHAVIAAGFEKLAQALQDPRSLAWGQDVCSVAVNALYNTCVDYEPAQHRAVLLKLQSILVDLLSVPGWELGCSVFELVAMLTTRAGGADATLLRLEDLRKLLSSARVRCGPNAETAHLLTAVLCYFADNPSLWYAPEASQEAIETLQMLDKYGLSLQERPSAEDDEDRQLADECLRDAITSIVQSYDLDAHQGTPLIESHFLPWLTSSRPRLVECACLVLGNHALKSTQFAVGCVSSGIHVSLLVTISGAADLAAKHAAAGFLATLALPAEAKRAMLEPATTAPLEDNAHPGCVTWTAIQSLLREKDFTLIKDAFVLFNAFVKGSLEACRSLLLSDQAGISASSRFGVLTSTCSKMHGNSPFTAEPLAACARGITTMTRTMLRPGMPSIDRYVELFFGDPWLLYPLSETLCHSEDKARRLDSTVGLARIACSHPEGAAAVARALCSAQSGLLDAVRRICAGDEKESKANCHVIIESVLRLALDACTPQVQVDLVSIQRLLVAAPG